MSYFLELFKEIIIPTARATMIIILKEIYNNPILIKWAV